MFEDLVTWMTGDLKLTVLVEPTVKNEFIGKFPQLRTWYTAQGAPLSLTVAQDDAGTEGAV